MKRFTHGAPDGASIRDPRTGKVRYAGSLHAEARRGAAAMRHAAFERRTFASDWIATQIHPARVQAIGQTPVKPGDRDYVAAWWEERQQGCPAWREDA